MRRIFLFSHLNKICKFSSMNFVLFYNFRNLFHKKPIWNPCLTSHKFYVTSKVSYSEINSNITENDSSLYVLKGWIKRKEKNEDVINLYISNGLSPNDTKVIVPKILHSSSFNIYSPVSLFAEKNEEDEYIAKQIETEGETLQKLERKYLARLPENENILKDKPWLRFKFSHYTNILSARSNLKELIHKYSHENEYLEVETPILTRYVRDSSHEAFYIETNYNIGENPINVMFGNPVYLSVCGQIHLECMSKAIGKVYSVGPSFRGSVTSGKSLSEFWTVCYEENYDCENECDAFDLLVSKFEDFLRQIFREFLNLNGKNFHLEEEAQNLLRSVLDKKWIRLTYADTILKLQEREKEVKYRMEYGMELKRNCENILLQEFDESPIFVTEFPYYMKPFNAFTIRGTERTLSFDILLPRIGEIGNGAVREHDYKKIEDRLTEYGAESYFSWYLDACQWGSGSTMGFSVGIERLLYFLLCKEDIKRVIAFPRYSGSCKC